MGESRAPCPLRNCAFCAAVSWRYACADVLLERLEREGLISDDERKQLANDAAAACGLASGSIFRGVDDK